MNLDYLYVSYQQYATDTSTNEHVETNDTVSDQHNCWRVESESWRRVNSLILNWDKKNIVWSAPTYSWWVNQKLGYNYIYYIIQTCRLWMHYPIILKIAYNNYKTYTIQIVIYHDKLISVWYGIKYMIDTYI